MTATVFYPDVSHYNAGLRIAPGTVAVCAKATEGTGYRDPSYGDFEAQAAAVGALFFGYHWIHRGNVDAQAAFCHSVVGDTPVMIDCEDTGDVPTVADCVAFAAGMRARGGRCTVVYLPHWYWQSHLGSPDLRPLAVAGLSLVSSAYTAYSDTGPGWAAYGGVAPALWQFSDNPVDRNAFRGSPEQLRALVNGTTQQGDTFMSLSPQAEQDLIFTVKDIADGTDPTQRGDKAPNNLHRKLDALVAAAAADKARDDAMAAAIKALAAGGTSIDTTAILAHIDQVAAAESATVTGLQQQITDLQGKLAAALAAAGHTLS